jgi:hypothetical protein
VPHRAFTSSEHRLIVGLVLLLFDLLLVLGLLQIVSPGPFVLVLDLLVLDLLVLDLLVLGPKVGRPSEGAMAGLFVLVLTQVPRPELCPIDPLGLPARVARFLAGQGVGVVASMGSREGSSR